MTKKAQEYMARREAQLLGHYLSGQDLPGHLMRLPNGVVAPRTPMAHSGGVSDQASMPVKGEVTIEVRPILDNGKKGKWETVEHDPNLVVSLAEGLMANAMAGVANSAFNYIELGDPVFPANAPALSDIALQQTTGVRKIVSPTVAANVITSTTTFLTSEGNGFSFTESGLFTGPFAAGAMFARKAFNTIIKTSGFEMRFTWLITFLVSATGGNDCTGVSLIGPSTVANETIFESGAGGEASVAATFNFTVGAAHIDVFLNGQRLVRTRSYNESAAPLAAPIGGPAANKGVNFIGFTLNPGDVIYLVQRTIS